MTLKTPKENSPRGGFTLIELLIVIAIILILIAIALPNFLEAQIRSRVARAQAELRTLTTAMEAYYLDWNFYPTRTQGNIDVRIREEAGHNWLTSPISYIESVPRDPFAGNVIYAGGQNANRTYESGGIELASFPCPSCMATWVIYSSGPSENSEPELRATNAHFTTGDAYPGNHIKTYSATNGTRSQGVIHRYGGDGFWIGVGIPTANRKAYNANPTALDVGLSVDYKRYLHTLPPPG